jgi:SprT protein
MDNQTVRELIQYACDCNGCPELAGRIELEWSTRMFKTMGFAIRGKGRRIIRLSVKLFGRADEFEQWDTIIHETCHLIADSVNPKGAAHGTTWAACMRRAGCEPEVYHSVDTGGLTTEYIYNCPNGCDDFPMTVRKHRNLQSGRVRRICRKCRERIFWTGRVSEPTLQAAQSERPETC